MSHDGIEENTHHTNEEGNLEIWNDVKWHTHITKI